MELAQTHVVALVAFREGDFRVPNLLRKEGIPPPSLPKDGDDTLHRHAALSCNFMSPNANPPQESCLTHESQRLLVAAPLCSVSCFGWRSHQHVIS